MGIDGTPDRASRSLASCTLDLLALFSLLLILTCPLAHAAERGLRLRGVVYARKGNALPEAKVCIARTCDVIDSDSYLWRVGNQACIVRVNGDAQFAVDLREMPESSAWVVVTATARGYASSSRLVCVTRDRTPLLVAFTLDESATLSGRLREQEPPIPATGARVYMWRTCVGPALTPSTLPHIGHETENAQIFVAPTLGGNFGRRGDPIHDVAQVHIGVAGEGGVIEIGELALGVAYRAVSAQPGEQKVSPILAVPLWAMESAELIIAR